MRKLTKTIQLIGAITVALLLPACLESDGEDSSNMSADVTYTPALATVMQPITTAGDAIIEIDYEGTAHVVNPELLTRSDAAYVGQRIFFTYRAAAAYPSTATSRYIEILTLQKILTKQVDILGGDEADTFGTDPISLSVCHIGPTHLTLEFQVMLNTSSHISHRISLVAEEDAQPDADGFVDLQLRHDANGDLPQTLSSAAYVSFALDSVPGYREGTLQGVRIAYTSLEQESVLRDYPFTESKSLSSPMEWAFADEETPTPSIR